MKGGDQGFENGESGAGFNTQRQNTENIHPDWHSSMSPNRMVPTSREYPVTAGVRDPDYLTLAVLSAGTK